MKFRSRQRWLRRLALGLALTALVAGGRVSPAGAKPVTDVVGTRYVTGQGGRQVIPYLSHGILTQEQADALSPAARPDDRGDRFVFSDVSSGAQVTAREWPLDAAQAVELAVGALALAFGLGLGLLVAARRGPTLAGH